MENGKPAEVKKWEDAYATAFAKAKTTLNQNGLTQTKAKSKVTAQSW